MKTKLLGLFLLFTACGQPSAEAPTAPQPATTPIAAPTSVPEPSESEPPTRFVASRLYETFAAAADTVLRLPGHSYRLSWQVRLDTLQPLTHVTPPDLVNHFPGDTSRGFQGYYKVEVRDSLGHSLGRHTFTKADFYPAVGPELAISSEVELPRLLGYSEPLGGLVFTVPFNAPETDWYGESTLVLSPSGQVRHLGPGTGSGGADVAVTLASNGRTLLTETEIIRASGPPLLLYRPGAELRGAWLVNDSLAVTIYEPGQTQMEHTSLAFNATPKQKRQSNTFVLNTHSGKVVNRFRYDGFYEELGFIIPCSYLRETQTSYFLDDKKGIYTLSSVQPTRVRYLPFDSLARFKAPKRASEIGFELNSLDKQYQFYVDTAAPAHIRYQRLSQ